MGQIVTVFAPGQDLRSVRPALTNKVSSGAFGFRLFTLTFRLDLQSSNKIIQDFLIPQR